MSTIVKLAIVAALVVSPQFPTKYVKLLFTVTTASSEIREDENIFFTLVSISIFEFIFTLSIIHLRYDCKSSYVSFPSPSYISYSVSSPYSFSFLITRTFSKSPLDA